MRRAIPRRHRVSQQRAKTDALQACRCRHARQVRERGIEVNELNGARTGLPSDGLGSHDNERNTSRLFVAALLHPEAVFT